MSGWASVPLPVLALPMALGILGLRGRLRFAKVGHTPRPREPATHLNTPVAHLPFRTQLMEAVAWPRFDEGQLSWCKVSCFTDPATEIKDHCSLPARGVTEVPFCAPRACPEAGNSLIIMLCLWNLSCFSAFWDWLLVVTSFHKSEEASSYLNLHS